MPHSQRYRDQVDDADPRQVLDETIRAHRRSPLSRTIVPRGLGPYRGYAEMLEAVGQLASRGARLEVAGRSVRGEPLFAVHLGGATGATGGSSPQGGATGASSPQGGATGASPQAASMPNARTRTTVVLSGVHPNEWIGIETHLALLERLAGVDLGGRALVSFPIVNPDSVLAVEMNLRTGRRHFVRNNARGVDLNRNFDARWGHRGLVQRLSSLWSSPGARAESEPEVGAIAQALANRRVDRALSLHSFGGAVLYPAASSRWPVPDAGEHRTWARRVARAAAPRAYRATAAAWWGPGITLSGLELDWFHDRHGALSLLVECSRGGFSLHPSRLLQPFAWFNPPNVDDITGPLVDALAPFVRGLPA